MQTTMVKPFGKWSMWVFHICVKVQDGNDIMYVCLVVNICCWIAWVGCVPIWKSNKWWNSFLTCPKCISSFSSTHEFCFSLCILSKHMLKGSKARPKSQSWTLSTDTNWIDWDWDDFPGETSYQTSFLFVECNLKASPEVKVSEVTCWYELCGKLC